MRPEDDPGWGAYGQTILRFASPLALDIDLSLPVADASRESLALRGLDRPFGILTPDNPRGRRSSEALNANRRAQFLGDLDAMGTDYQRVDGLSPDRKHVEQGVALIWPQGAVVALARQWEQSAIYWWDGATFWVVGALTLAEPCPLGGSP